LVAGLAVLLAVPGLSVVAASAQGAATTTTLSLGAQSGCAQALTTTVLAKTGQAATGTVSIEDEFNGQQVQLANVALNAQGSATTTVSLSGGSHVLTAVYAGNSSDLGSSSASSSTITIANPCQFTVAISNLAPASSPPNTLTPGQSGTATVTVTASPDYTASLSGPLFVTLSCSGLPDEASCTFTPENVEILPGQETAVTSSMVISTVAATASAGRSPRVDWAFLLPGALSLCGLAWGARRRPWLNRLALLALVGLVTLLGTTACAPRYNYYNHGPPTPPATPAGTYTVTVTAQSSNGVAAITNSTTLALTVQ